MNVIHNFFTSHIYFFIFYPLIFPVTYRSPGFNELMETFYSNSQFMDNFSLTQIVSKWLSQKFRGYTATALAIHWVDSCLTNRKKTGLLSLEILSECQWAISRDIINLIHKSQNAPVRYPTMLHSEQKCAHFYPEWSIMGYRTGAFWDLWNWSITRIQALLHQCPCNCGVFMACTYPNGHITQ